MKEWLTSTDIANITGLKVRTLYKYRERNTLPEPDMTIDQKPLWKRSTINEWIESRPTLEKESK